MCCAQASSTQRDASSQQSIIISTDLATGLAGGWLPGANEVDDGFAVLMGLDAKNLRTLGITLVYGNNYVDNEIFAANRLLNFLPSQKRVPIKKGASLPLEVEQSYWIDSKDHKLINSTACVNDAVKFMADMLNKNNHVTLVGLGPLTDIACLIKTYPHLQTKINNIIALMGRYPDQSLRFGDKVMIDFNYALDPLAAKIVLEQKSIPVTIIPFQLSSSVFISRDELPTSAKKNSLGEYLTIATQNWMQLWNQVFGQNGFHPWDAHVIYYLTNPNEYQCEKMGYKVLACDIQDSNCIDHKKIDPQSLLSKETSQLLLSPNYQDSKQILVCTSLIKGAKERFVKTVMSYTTK